MPPINKSDHARPHDDGPTKLPTFDLDTARQRLAQTRGPVFWRSLEELADDHGFQHWLRLQHPQLAQTLDMDRRGFLKLLGASLALAGVSACSAPPEGDIVPFVHGQPGRVGGLPQFFATALTRHGFAHGVLVESNSGRPTKVEGNPHHPASLGATDIFAQASVLQFWDPDRSKSVMHGDTNATWNAFAGQLLTLSTRWRADAGAGLHVLTGSVTSPTLLAQLDALLRLWPKAQWHVHEPTQGTAGYPEPSPRLHLDRARVVLALDADFLTDPAAGVRYAHDFAAARSPDRTHAPMTRLYVIEPTPSITGGMADHHLALETHRLQNFAKQLAVRLGAAAGSAGATFIDARQSRWLDAIGADLRAHAGQALVLAGRTQPAFMHALARAMNQTLDNIGKTIEYLAPVQGMQAHPQTLGDLARAMHAGDVHTLLALDTNPSYDAPIDLAFNTALHQVPQLVHLGLYRNETARRAHWHLPMAHALESWGDARAFDGTASIVQPLIAPLYGGRSTHEILAMLTGDEVQQGRALVRRQWLRELPDAAAWAAALQTGVIPASAYPTNATQPGISGAADPIPVTPPSDAAALELLFRPDPTIDDGRWANNGWLQELPKPLTTLTWDNAALISPVLAAREGLASGDMVELQLHGRTLKVPVWLMPGQAERSVTLHLGYGRRAAGHVGDGQGFNAYLLRTSTDPWNARGLQLRMTGERFPLATTQHHFNMEGRNLLRIGTLAQYRQDPAFATANDRYPEPPPSLYPDAPPDDYAWGMSIDLNACIGCNACTIACQAENNIPVVGKDQVQRGREMHWIRVDRYFEGGPDDPRSYAQPVPCMMCEHAPCEVVCPVGATVHDNEGLNLQVYNRCVGTRFCSNNCPYKVRRFNFLQYIDKTSLSHQAERNPEVSVRRRGVMEKCTYCIQRIENAHIEADKTNRRIGDGDVVTACQAVCPAQAIRFGDISDPQSRVSQAKASARNYAMLNELGTRPRTTYLARVRNPNPDLADHPANGPST